MKKDKFNEHNYIIKTLTGPNLENILEFLGSWFDLIIVANIGIQLLNILEALHNRGILHWYIKACNIGYGLFSKGKLIKDNKIVLLDYGSSIKYIYGQYKEDKQGISYEIGKFHYLPNKLTKIAGKYSYMFDDNLEGKCPSRKTELENLMYAFIYLFKYSLPWTGLNDFSGSDKRSRIIKKRKNIEINELFRELLKEFLFIYQSVKRLTFLTKPNYELFRNKLKQVILALGETIESEFCFKRKIVKDIQDLNANNIKKKNFNRLQKLFKGYPIFK